MGVEWGVGLGFVARGGGGGGLGLPWGHRQGTPKTCL